MILIVGLRNPGAKYKNTRHNIGFGVIKKFARKNNFPKFKLLKELSSLISEKKFNNDKIILANLQTFMNLSGKGAKLLIDFHQLPIANLWVVHDDIDLPLGKIRIAKNRGAGGHKGVESIIKELKTKNFIRFRIGIKPKPYTLTPKTLDRFVLQKFNKEEEKIVKEVIKKTAEAIKFFLKTDLEKTMNKYNA